MKFLKHLVSSYIYKYREEMGANWSKCNYSILRLCYDDRIRSNGICDYVKITEENKTAIRKHI